MKEDEYIVTPCCYKKQLKEIFDEAQKRINSERIFASNSDWQLSQLLEWAVWRAPSSFMTLCLPNLADDTISMLDSVLNRIDCPVWRNKRHLVTRLYMILPRSEYDRDSVRQFLDRHKQQIVAAWAKTELQVFMMQSFYEPPIMSDKEQILAREIMPFSITVKGVLNQHTDGVFRVGSVSYCNDTHSMYTKMLAPFFRVHEIPRDLSVSLLEQFQ